jgi:hypothetical protein
MTREPSKSERSSIEVLINPFGLENLDVLRNRVSRLYYAPSRKTLVKALVAVFFDGEVPDESDLSSKLEASDRAFSISLTSGQAHKLGKLFPRRTKQSQQLSHAINRILTVSFERFQSPEVLGKILQQLRRGAYVVNKSLITLRIPNDLEDFLVHEHPSDDENDDFGCWRTRLKIHSRSFQEELRKQLMQTLKSGDEEARMGKVSSFPPFKWENFLVEAKRQLGQSTAAKVYAVPLPKSQWRELRKLQAETLNSSEEVVAVALLLWRRSTEQVLPAS